VSCAETAEAFEMPFEWWTRGPKEPCTTCKGAVLRAKWGWPGTCPMVVKLKATQQGLTLVWCGCQLGCSRWGACWVVGATWQIRLNCLCVLAMRALCQSTLTTCIAWMCVNDMPKMNA